MKNGARPTRIDHRDFDFHKSFGSVAPVQFPTEYFCDAGRQMPNQEVEDSAFAPPVSPIPYGCTDEAQGSLATDLTAGATVYRPDALDAVTHANANGGFDIRQSFLAAVKLGWFTAFYNITTSGLIDHFDSFRLAQISGAPEKRSISWGTPWFPSWEAAIQRGVRVMPMPTQDELADLSGIPWHNSKLDGWTNSQNGGVLTYRDSSWQGPEIGFVYFTREVINVVMSISGTVAFTGTKMTIANPISIDTTIVQMIVSYIRNLLGLQ